MFQGSFVQSTRIRCVIISWKGLVFPDPWCFWVESVCKLYKSTLIYMWSTFEVESKIQMLQHWFSIEGSSTFGSSSSFQVLKAWSFSHISWQSRSLTSIFSALPINVLMCSRPISLTSGNLTFFSLPNPLCVSLYALVLLSAEEGNVTPEVRANGKSFHFNYSIFLVSWPAL